MDLRDKLKFWIMLSNYVDMIVRGTSPLSLPDAIANSLSYVKAFGGTELVPETYIDTVTADGKCEQRNLPDGYIERQYIYMMDGSYLAVENQSITSDYKIEFDFATTNLPSSLANYFGARASGVSAGGGFRVSKLSNNGVAMYGFDTTDAYESGGNVLSADTRYKYVYENGTCTISSGGTDVLTHTYTVNDTSTITAFGINAYTSNGTSFAASPVGIYCYGLKLWNGQGELVMNLVPVVQKGTVPVVGFYDTVSETFMTATSGTFAAGGEAVPTPDYPMNIVCNNGVLKVNKNLITGSLTQGIYNDGVLDPSVATWVAYNTFIPVESGKTYTLKATPSVTGKTIEQNVMKYKDGVYIGYTTLANVPYTFTPDSTYNQVKLQFAYQPRENINPSNITDVQLYQNGSIYTDGTVETITDNVGNVANCERLLSVGTYKDTQEILSGAITHNIGIKVFDGTESWQIGGNNTGVYMTLGAAGSFASGEGFCTHSIINPNSPNIVDMNQNEFCLYSNGNMSFKNANTTSVSDWKTFLSDQYAAGTPVIVVYPLATATTETVTGQYLEKEPVTAVGSLSNLVATAVSSSHSTPTPIHPLDINCNNGVLKYGNVSKNLFDEDYPNVSNSMKYLPIYLGPGTYTCSYSFRHNDSGTSLIYFLNGNVSSGAGNGTNQVDASNPRTVSSSTGYVTIAYRNGSGIGRPGEVPTDYNCMLASGGTEKPYEPYRLAVYADGLQETINIHTKNLFDEQWNRNTGVSTQTATWGQVVSAQGWSTSGLVPVKAGQQYTVSYNSTVAIYVFYYESDGTMQQSYDYATSNTKKTFTVPNGATHIRLQVNKNTAEAIADLETQLETGATDTAYVPYFNGGTAVAEMLLKIDSTYTDQQEIIDGTVTRNVGIKVMTGNETFQAGTNGWISEDTITNNLNAIYTPICTHFAGTDATPVANSNTVRVYYTSQNVPRVYFGVDKTIPEFSSTTAFQQWLADQYNAGTPVTIVYPLATATTETVTGQPMATTQDDNLADITQASMSGLELSVKYLKKA